jgi:hypothetical protein
MSKRTKENITKATKLRNEASDKAASGDFLYKIASQSLSAHIDELNQYAAIEEDRPLFELLDFRLKAANLKSGPIPLRLISQATEEIRAMIGYAALRLVEGGIDRQRVPKDLYEELDLRLAGILPGSSRIVVTANANRDLFDDGLNKGALDRLFDVLNSGGSGKDFLQAVADLGPLSTKRLREFLKLVRSYSAEAEITWSFGGNVVKAWEGDKKRIDTMAEALEQIEISDQERVVLAGKIELLSKRERLDLRLEEGRMVRVLFPKALFPTITALHLDQNVRLRCQVTETTNPHTNESSTFYELVEILS